MSGKVKVNWYIPVWRRTEEGGGERNNPSLYFLLLPLILVFIDLTVADLK